ncbi:MAG: hypothetical protein ACOC1F_11600 [Myxococcota bacterium]
MPKGERRPRLVHTVEEGPAFWVRDDSGWAIVDAHGAASSIRGPRGEIQTKPIHRFRFGMNDVPSTLRDRLV